MSERADHKVTPVRGPATVVRDRVRPASHNERERNTSRSHLACTESSASCSTGCVRRVVTRGRRASTVGVMIGCGSRDGAIVFDGGESRYVDRPNVPCSARSCSTVSTPASTRRRTARAAVLRDRPTSRPRSRTDDVATSRPSASLAVAQIVSSTTHATGPTRRRRSPASAPSTSVVGSVTAALRPVARRAARRLGRCGSARRAPNAARAGRRYRA